MEIQVNIYATFFSIVSFISDYKIDNSHTYTRICLEVSKFQLFWFSQIFSVNCRVILPRVSWYKSVFSEIQTENFSWIDRLNEVSKSSCRRENFSSTFWTELNSKELKIDTKNFFFSEEFLLVEFISLFSKSLKTNW